MKPAHYTQALDLGERGRVECTRDDTDEEVNFHLTAWMDGKQTHEIKIRYNIMYDYERVQNWWNGCLVEDLLEASYFYGHLIAEDCSEGNFKDDFEPINPLGCEMFQNQTWWRQLALFENRVEVDFGYSPYPPYGIQQTGKIVELKKPADTNDLFLARERSRLEGLHFDPLHAREKRLQFYKEYSEWLKTEVPIDMSMVD